MTDPKFRQRFLNAMSRAAATVNVVTTDGPAGLSGVTVSAMSSVSADAKSPIILVCLHHLGKSVPIILENASFAVNVLREDQSYIADTFAGRKGLADDELFSTAPWTAMSSGCPRVVDPLVAFDCKILSATKVGTHYVVMGEVEDIFIAESGRPLIFANRSYGSAERILPFSVETSRPENALRIGVHCAFGSRLLPPLIKQYQENFGNIEIDLYEGDQLRISALLQAGDIDMAIVYDTELDDQLQKQTLEPQRPYVLVASSHPLAQKDRLTLHELSAYPMILLDAPPMRDYLTSLFSHLQLNPSIAYRPWYIDMAKAMVANELGYALMMAAAEMVPDNQDNGLVGIPLEDDLPALDAVLAFPGGSLSTSGQAFVEVCANTRQS